MYNQSENRHCQKQEAKVLIDKTIKEFENPNDYNTNLS